MPNVTGLVPVTQPLYKNWKMAGIAGRPSSIIPSGFYIHNDFVMSNYDKQAAIIEGINRHNRPNCYNHSHIRDVLRFEEVFDEYGLHAGTRLAPPGFNSYIKYMYLSNIPEYMTFNEVTGRLEPKFPLIRPATPLEESTYLFKRNILTPNNKQRMAVFFMDCNDRQLQQLGLTLKKASGLLRPSVVEPEAEINYKSSNLTLARLEEYRSKLSSSSSDTYRPEMYSDRKAMTYGTEPSVPSSVAIPSAIRAIFAKAYGEGVCSGKLYDEKISSFSYNYNVFSKELDSV